jgi:hypothetical protein
LLAEVDGPRFFGEERIGAGFDEASISTIGVHDAAEARRALEKNVVEGGPCAALLLECEGSGESADASTDDGNASHGLI